MLLKRFSKPLKFNPLKKPNNFLQKTPQCSFVSKTFLNFQNIELKRSILVLSSFNSSYKVPSSLSKENSFAFISSRWFATEALKVIKVPGMGDSISEGTIKTWHKKPGSPVKMDDLVATIETDKVAVEIRAPENGVLKETFANEGDSVHVGTNLYSIDVNASAPTGSTPASTDPVPPKPAQNAAPKPSPSVSETSKTKPSTSSGAPSPSSGAQQSPKETSKPSAPSVSTPSGKRDEHRVKMSRMRERIAQRLKDSQNTYAMLTTFNEIDMSAITSLRNEYKDIFLEKHGVKLGFMSCFVRAAAIALREQPSVNAVIDGNEIIYRDYVDISVAVSTPTGLVVPVLRNADKLSFAEIEKEIARLGKKARDGSISLEDMAGGTFTISNGGVYGSMMGTPIINPPQSSILGMHAINNRPVVVKDQIVIRPVMYVALTYDHRLIDGKEAVTFLKAIKHYVEDPRRMLLDV